jgi:hypothetical protein
MEKETMFFGLQPSDERQAAAQAAGVKLHDWLTSTQGQDFIEQCGYVRKFG